MSTHRARITWTDARRTLPTGLRYVAPARLDDLPPPWIDDTWSLVCSFDSPPAEQGSPSVGRVEFMVEAAPHSELKAGSRLRLWEGADRVAVVDVLE